MSGFIGVGVCGNAASSSGGTVAAGTLMSATLLRDGWTVELAYHGLAAAPPDPSKLTSVSLVYPATDYFGVPLGPPPAVYGVSSHASPWWDADHPLPAPYVDGGLLKVPVKINAPVRSGDAGVVSVDAGLVPGSLAGVAVLDCSATMLEHMAVVEANPDPLGGLTARVEAPYGCRKLPSELTLFEPGVTSLPAGWDFDAAFGLRAMSAGAAPLVGIDTNGWPIVLRQGARVIDCVARLTPSSPASTAAVIISNGPAVTGASLEWLTVDGGWRQEQAGAGAGRGILEGLYANVVGNSVQRCHVLGTRDDGVHMSGPGALVRGLYIEAGGWTEGSGDPHFDWVEMHPGNAGSNAVSTYDYCFTDNRLRSTPTSTNYEKGRTSDQNLASAPYGVNVRRNVAGVGCREYDRQGFQRSVAIASTLPVSNNIKIEDCFYDKPAGAPTYHAPSASFYGVSKWSNNRDLRTGAIIPDSTARRRRLTNGDYRIASAGNRRVS